MRITSNINFGGHTAYDEFSKVAVQTGLIKTMLALTQRKELDSVRASASYQAMDTIARLMTSGTTAERRSLVTDLVQRDIIKIALNVSLSDSLSRWKRWSSDQSTSTENGPPFMSSPPSSSQSPAYPDH